MKTNKLESRYICKS